MFQNNTKSTWYWVYLLLILFIIVFLHLLLFAPKLAEKIKNFFKKLLGKGSEDDSKNCSIGGQNSENGPPAQKEKENHVKEDSEGNNDKNKNSLDRSANEKTVKEAKGDGQTTSGNKEENPSIGPEPNKVISKTRKTTINIRLFLK